MLQEALVQKELGNAAFKCGRYEEALGYYDKAVTVIPKHLLLIVSVMHANKAAVYMKQKRPFQCIQACNEAIKNDPQNLKALLRRAWAYEERGNLNAWDVAKGGKKNEEDEESDRGASALEAALNDYKAIVQLQRHHPVAMGKVASLPGRIEKRKKEEQDEVMGWDVSILFHRRPWSHQS